MSFSAMIADVALLAIARATGNVHGLGEGGLRVVESTSTSIVFIALSWRLPSEVTLSQL